MGRWSVAALVMAVSLPLAGVSAVPAHAVAAGHVVRADDPVTFGEVVCDQVTVTLDASTSRMASGSAAGGAYDIVVDGKVVASGTIEPGDKVSKTVRIPVGKTVKIEVVADGKTVASATRTGIDCTPAPPPKPDKPKKHKKHKKHHGCRMSVAGGSCKGDTP